MSHHAEIAEAIFLVYFSFEILGRNKFVITPEYAVNRSSSS